MGNNPAVPPPAPQSSPFGAAAAPAGTPPPGTVPQVSAYGSSPNAPTVVQPLSSQPTQYAPPPVGGSGTWPVQPAGAGNVPPPPPPPPWVVQPAVAPPPWAPQQPAPPPWAAQPVAPPPGAIPSRAPTPPGIPGTRRRMPRWQRNLLIAVAALLILTGVWFIIARPAIHGSVDSQIQQGLQSATNQIPVLPSDTPGYTFNQSDINSYIARNSSQFSPLTDLQVSLQPGAIVVTFKTFGFGSTVQLGLALSGGTLVATNVSVSGLLSWVESADELTPRLDTALSNASGRLGQSITGVQIKNGEIDFIFASSSQPSQ